MIDFNPSENKQPTKENNRSQPHGNNDGSFHLRLNSTNQNLPSLLFNTSTSQPSQEGIINWTPGGLQENSKLENSTMNAGEETKSTHNKRNKPHKHSIPLVTPQNTILKPQPLYDPNSTNGGDKDTNRGVSQSGPCGQQTATGGRGYSFPDQLYQMINTEDDSVMEWADSGKAFYIRANITEKITKYFRQTKLESFQRQLNLYGFTLLTKGEDRGAYFHPQFLRDQPELCQLIKRTPGRGARATARDLTVGSAECYTNGNGNKQNGKRGKNGKDYDPTEDTGGENKVDQRGIKRKSSALLPHMYPTPNPPMLCADHGMSNPQYPPYSSPHRPHMPHLFTSSSASKPNIGHNGTLYGVTMSSRPQPSSQPNPSFNFHPHQSQHPQHVQYSQPFPSPSHPIPSPPPSQPQYPYSNNILRQSPQGPMQSNIAPPNIMHDGQMTNPSASSTSMIDYGRSSNTSPEISTSIPNFRNSLTPPGSLHIPSQINSNSSSHRTTGIPLNGLQTYPQQSNSYVTPRTNRSGSQVLLESVGTIPPRMQQDYNNNCMTPNSQGLSQESSGPTGSSTSNGNLKTGNSNPGMSYNIPPPHSQPIMQTTPSNQQHLQQQQNINVPTYSNSNPPSFNNFLHPSSNLSDGNQYIGVNDPVPSPHPYSNSNIPAPTLTSSPSNTSAYSMNSNTLSNPNENVYPSVEMRRESYNNEVENEKAKQRSNCSPSNVHENNERRSNTGNESNTMGITSQKWMNSSPTLHDKTGMFGKSNMVESSRNRSLITQSLANGNITPNSRSSVGEAHTAAISPTSSLGPPDCPSDRICSISTERSNGKNNSYPYTFEGRNQSNHSTIDPNFVNEDTDIDQGSRSLSSDSDKSNTNRNIIEERKQGLSFEAKKILERLSEKQIRHATGKLIQERNMLANKDPINYNMAFQPPVFLTQADLFCRKENLSDSYVFPTSVMTVVDSPENMNKFFTEENTNPLIKNETFMESKTNKGFIEVNENERLFDMEGSLLDMVYHLTQQGEHVTLVSCFDSLEEVCFQDLFIRTGVTSGLIHTIEKYVDSSSGQMKSSILFNEQNRHPSTLYECNLKNKMLVETAEDREREQKEELEGDYQIEKNEDKDSFDQGQGQTENKRNACFTSDDENQQEREDTGGIFYFPSTPLLCHNETNKYEKYDLPAIMNLILIPMYKSLLSQKTSELKISNGDNRKLYRNCKIGKEIELLKNVIALSAGLNRNVKNIANRSTTLVVYVKKTNRDEVVNLLNSPFLHEDSVKEKEKETDKEDGTGTEMKRTQTQAVLLKSYFRKIIIFCK